jgi:hypothetical protein
MQPADTTPMDRDEPPVDRLRTLNDQFASSVVHAVVYLTIIAGAIGGGAAVGYAFARDRGPYTDSEFNEPLFWLTMVLGLMAIPFAWLGLSLLGIWVEAKLRARDGQSATQ